MKPPRRITAEDREQSGAEAGAGAGGGSWYPGSPVLQEEDGDGGGGARARQPGVSGAALASPPSPSPASPQSSAVGLMVPGAVPVPRPGAGET